MHERKKVFAAAMKDEDMRPKVDDELTDVVGEVLNKHSGSCLDNDPERNALTIALVEQLTRWFYMRVRQSKGKMRCP